jgi:hypothetical protein
MPEQKSGLIKKIAKAGIALGLSLLSVTSNGQKLKEDINWTKVKEPYGKYTLTIRSTSPLNELSKYKSNPTSYLPRGNLNIGYNNTYTIPQDSIKGNILNYLKKIDVCPDCNKSKKSVSTKKKLVKPTPKKELTSIVQDKPLPTKPIVEPQIQIKKDTLKEEKATIEYNVNETNITNNYNINNNYLPPEKIRDTVFVYPDTLKKEKSGLEVRALFEGNKKANSITSPFWGVSGAFQFGRGSFWGSVYGTAGFGKEKEIVTNNIENETLLNQTLQLFTGTKGTRTEKSEISYPFEFGGLVSINSKDNRIRLDLGYGLVKETNTTSGVSESGIDYMRQGDKIIQEKPYSIELEKGKTYNNILPTQKASLNFEILKGFYLGAEAKHIGSLNKDNLKKENMHVNIKAGLRIGGGRR